jgi:hypothetical protein
MVMNRMQIKALRDDALVDVEAAQRSLGIALLTGKAEDAGSARGALAAAKQALEDASSMVLVAEDMEIEAETKRQYEQASHEIASARVRTRQEDRAKAGR